MTELNKSEAVAQSTLGAELDADECEALAGRMGLQVLKPGDLLVREGEQRNTLFVLAKGKLNVCKAVGEHEETVYQMRIGECAGTRAFIDGSERKAALCADTDAASC
jgi:CRP/FNR family cyclic AMP-dependent transcriptional regulator